MVEVIAESHTGTDPAAVTGTLGLADRRPRSTILTDILLYCQFSRRTTHIVYACDVNFHTIKGYLTILIGAELLDKTGTPRKYRYRTTEKGLDWARKMKTLLGVI